MAGEAAQPVDAASLRSVLRQREFGALFLAHLLSLLGDRLATVAISVMVYSASGSVLLTAVAYGTSLLPWLIGAPVLAALSDRWPRRRVLVTCDLVRAGLVMALVVPGEPLAVLLVLLTAVAWLGPAFEAARAATLPVVLPQEEEYLAAATLTMLSNQTSQVLGLAGGGLLLTVLTTQQALVLDSATFVVSAGLILAGLLPRAAVWERAERPRLWQSVTAGARFTFSDPTLRSVLMLSWLVAAVTVLPEGVAIATAHQLHAPGPVGGILMAAVPAGSVVGAVWLRRIDATERTQAMLPVSAVGLVALVLSAFTDQWPVLWLCWFSVGLGAAVQLPASALFMRRVPDALRARAYGLAQTGLMAGQGLALVLGGAVAEAVGIPRLLAGAGLLGLGLLAVLRRGWPIPRQVRGRAPLQPVDTWILIVTFVAVVAAGLELWLGHARPAPWRLSPYIIGAAFFATGSYVARVRIGRQAHVFQLDDIPRLVGLVFLSPAALIGARLGGSLLALTIARRQTGRKLLFNLANFTIEVTIALAVFQLLDPGRGIEPDVWPAAVMATVLADLVSAWLVGVVIGLAEHDLRLRRVLAADKMALGTALGAATVGMIAATTLWYAPTSGLLTLLLVLLGMVGLRAFARLNAEGQDQQRLQVVLAEMANLEATHESLAQVLEAVRARLAVEALECWIVPQDEGLPMSGWTSVRAAGSELHLDEDARDALASTVLGEPVGPAGTLDPHALPGVPRHQVLADPRLQGRWSRRVPGGVHRLAAVVHGSGDRSGGPALGALVASGPIGDGRNSFSSTDAELLQTAAGLLSQALLRLEQRHQLLLSATHDRLTQLATPAEFRRCVQPLLETGSPMVLLLINLDRIRAVNDVFGRDTGDRLIAAAARRTVALAPEGSVVGRLSGHHFACAFPRPYGESVAQLARQLRSQLERPFSDQGIDAEVGVHIGVSLGPDHGREPEDLLRKAEAACERAKEDPFGVAVFTEDLEIDVARPLRLVRDLRVALEGHGQLAMHYQPKLSLVSGTVTGSEALIRWSHPELGAVPPDEFIGIAEQTGLITDITAFTLDEALRQSAEWSRAGLPGSVAVNLSARNLLDTGLVHTVLDALHRHGVDPHVLTLEITETSVMAQPVRSVLVLDALAELGVQLSIDDFGTGYSNLTYLRQLPVQEVKLDRSFLRPFRGEAPLGEGGGRASEFLRHAVALVHSLGLLVVVEGVEDQATLDALSALGADSVQGYFICRPLAAEGVTSWMAGRAGRHDSLDAV